MMCKSISFFGCVPPPPSPPHPTTTYKDRSSNNGHPTRSSNKVIQQGHPTRSSNKGHPTMVIQQWSSNKVIQQGHPTKVIQQGHPAMVIQHGHSAWSSNNGHPTRSFSMVIQQWSSNKVIQQWSFSNGHPTRSFSNGHPTMVIQQWSSNKVIQQGHPARVIQDVDTCQNTHSLYFVFVLCHKSHWLAFTYNSNECVLFSSGPYTSARTSSSTRPNDSIVRERMPCSLEV